VEVFTHTHTLSLSLSEAAADKSAVVSLRGNLKLKILSRSLQDYYLYRTDNVVQPSNFIGNKVAGIMFENKVDHTTFFGNNIEYVQGIHMLPLMPFTQLCRDGRFAREEWNAYFSEGRVDLIEGGWRGILYGNLATFDPQTAYRFFSSPSFDPSHLDGGASLTWYLCYAAGEFLSLPPAVSYRLHLWK